MIRRQKLFVTGIMSIYIGVMFFGVRQLYEEIGEPEIYINEIEIFAKSNRDNKSSKVQEEVIFDTKAYEKDYTSIEEMVNDAEIIAMIHVQGQQNKGDDKRLYSTVDVDKVYKGDIGDTFEIQEFPDARTLSSGRTYIVFVARRDTDSYIILGDRDGTIGIKDNGNIYGYDTILLRRIRGYQAIERVINEALADIL